MQKLQEVLEQNRTQRVALRRVKVTGAPEPNMSSPAPAPEPLLELIADRLRVIGQPLRIHLIAILREGPATVRELTDAVGAVQQNVSQHLAILHQARIVARRKEGTRVFYELVDPHAVSIIDSASASLARQSDELAKLTNERPA